MLASDAATLLEAVRQGWLFAIQYNPLFALGTSAVAAAFLGHPRAHRKNRPWAALVLVMGWLAGDGLRILGNARDFADGVSQFGGTLVQPWATWTVLAVWALGSLVLGYVIPAVAGGEVGKRVHLGTGWLAAAAIAVALSGTMSAILRATG